MDPLLDPALFTDSPPAGYVRRTGKIFEVGDYPDKKFSLTEAEADKAIAAFVPLQADVEHVPTILSGKLGILRSMERRGQDILGEADVPEWLDEALQGTASSVSLAWDRESKQPKGWGWVLEPRVTGAALMSAYAEFSQRQEEQEARSIEVARQRAAQGSGDKPSNGRKTRMGNTLIEKLQARFNAKPAAAPPATLPAPATTPLAEPTRPTINFSAPGTKAEGEDADAQSEEARVEFKADQIVTRATELVDQAIASSHLMSSGRDAALAAFTAAGFDNEEAGPSLVTFSKGDGTVVTDRMALLAEVLKHTPQHALFQSSLPVYILNGSKDPSETESAEDKGKKQAARFNAESGVATTQNTTATMNGNGAH